MSAAVYIAASVDGFIARADGGLDWLPPPEGSEDYGYAAFMASVDALVMGRKTFETVLGFGEWPYEKPVFVMSRAGVSIPERLAGRAEAVAGTPAEVLAALAARGLRRVYLDGGLTIHGFLAAGLVDELVITRVPVLLGEGIPLFHPRAGELKLRHVETRAFASGLVQSRYVTLADAP
ncbi:MAG: dihydrofolate reductase family protein [Polyangiales bacterium]